MSDLSDDLVRRNVLDPEHLTTRAGAEYAAIGSFNSILLHLSGTNVDRGPRLTNHRDDGQTSPEWRRQRSRAHDQRR